MLDSRQDDEQDDKTLQSKQDDTDSQNGAEPMDSVSVIETLASSFNSFEYFSSVLHNKDNRSNEKSKLEIDAMLQKIKSGVESCSNQEEHLTL